MMNADITREIATVMRDYEFALSKVDEGDRSRSLTAVSLAKLAQEERYKRPFWKRIF